jgi:beta-N-acetylhexosaminidase
MTGIPAGPLPSSVVKALRDGLAGVLLFGRNVDNAEQVRTLTADIRAANPHALIAIDEEGGSYGHLITAGVPAHVGNLALGVLDDIEVTRKAAFDMASGLAGLGINVDFAPCADVNSNPDNPVIGVRSFGAGPRTVARHTSAYVDGMQARGVAACVKHFPGHGDTPADSHHSLPSGTPSLLPFAGTRAAMMMSAHVVYPGLSAPGLSAGVPATLSRQLLTTVAREEMGFGGVIVTDAVEMRAISDTYPAPEAAVLALAAGADLVLTGDPVTEAGLGLIADAVEAAVADGRLRRARLDEAASRVTALAARFAAPSPLPAADGAADRQAAATLASRQLASPQLASPQLASPQLASPQLASRQRLGAGCFLVELRPANPGYRALHPGLVALALRRDPSVDGVTIETADEDLDAVLAQASGRSLVIAAPDDTWIRDMVSRLLAARPDATVINTGLPGTTGLNCYGRSPVMLGALLDLLL